MATRISVIQLDGTAVAEGGTDDTRTTGGAGVLTQGTHKSARGHLVLAADGKTVEFVSDSKAALEAVIAVS